MMAQHHTLYVVFSLDLLLSYLSHHLIDSQQSYSRTDVAQDLRQMPFLMQPSTETYS